MKKNLCKLIATSLLVFSLVACNSSKDSKKEEKEHVHNYDVQNIEWFWKQLQNKDYEAKATFTCLDCKEDVEGHSVTLDATVDKVETKEATCLEKGKYTYTAKVTFQEHEYSATKEREYEDATAHHFIEVKDAQYLKSAADCENDEVYYLSCEHCHETSEDTFTVPNTKLGHDLVHHDAKTPKCQENGNIEYWQCSRCDKYFLSEAGEPVNYSEIDLGRSHKMTKHEGNPPSCTSEGTLDYYTCEYEPGVKYYDEAGEHLVEKDEDLNVPATGHNFDGTLHCANCDKSFKEIYNLDDAIQIDGIAPTSLSEYGIADNTAVPIHTAGHVFGLTMNPKGVDLWFTFNYAEVKSGEDAQLAVYLFNQMDESGIRFRFETNRTEDDGIAFGYIITPAGATQVIFPKTANIKSGQTVTAHIFAYLTDASTNTFTVGYQAGVDNIYNPVVYPGGTGYEVDSPLFTTTATLGAGYFDAGAHRYLRISGIRNDSITIGEATSKEEVVVYKDEDGSLIGKDNGNTIHVVTYEKENKQFIGWFDQNGNKVEDNQEVTSKTIVQPLFIDAQEEMIVPSTTNFMNRGETKVLSQGDAEVASEFGYEARTNKVDLYYIYGINSRAYGDKYSITGFPYDMIDAKSRMYVRINENNGNYFDGYIYGGSLGGAGAEGTYFVSDANFRRASDKLLIHLSVEDKGSNNIDFVFEAINLRTRDSFSVSKNVTFESYSLSDTERNKFGAQTIGGLQYTITDAF